MPYSIRSLLEAVGRPGFDPRRIGVGKHSGTAVLADIFGVMADQPVALANDAVLELAGRRELEAFLDAALGLELGHFRLLVAPIGRDVIQPPRHAFWPGHWFFQRSGKRAPIDWTRRAGNLPGQLGAVAAEEFARVVDRQPLDQLTHGGNAFLRRNLGARAAHVGLYPAGTQRHASHPAWLRF